MFLHPLFKIVTFANQKSADQAKKLGTSYSSEQKTIPRKSEGTGNSHKTVQEKDKDDISISSSLLHEIRR
jgi:hypothetical protein